MKRKPVFWGVAVFLLWLVATQTWVSFSTRELVQDVRWRYEAAAEALGSLPASTPGNGGLETSLSKFLERDSNLRGILWESAREQLQVRRPGAGMAGTGYLPAVTLEYAVQGEQGLDGTLTFEYSQEALDGAVRERGVRIYAGTLALLGVLFATGYFIWRRTVQEPLGSFMAGISGLVRLDAGSLPGKEESLTGLLQGLRSELIRLKDLELTVSEMTANVRRESLRSAESFDVLSGRVSEGTRALTEAGMLVSGLDASQRDVHESSEMLAALFDENVSSVLEMRSSIGEIAGSGEDLFQSAELAYASVSEITGLSREISDSMAALTGTIDDAVTTLEQISASVRHVEESAREAAERALEVTERARGTGMAAVRDARGGMTKIHEEVSASAEIMDRLGQRSKDITKVLGVIREVTEQTNLLSLNAAILAAQAGEQGRAFGVVADEIASLAERTEGSTQEISMIVTTIRKEISAAIHSTGRAMSRVQEGGEMVGRTEDALADMLEHASTSSDMARKIERATVEQGEGIRQISGSVARIRDTSQRVVDALARQEKGMAPMTGHVGTVRGVVEMLRRSMQEQHEGIRSISENMQHTNEKLSQIAEATSPEKTALPELIQVFEVTERVRLTNEEALKQLGENLLTLSRITGELYESMSRNRV